MIVTCEQCETQFQLDDSKVPDGGIRVRCSRCKYAFFVESPQRSDSARADDLAREALVRDSVAASRDRSSGSLGLEDGESDWQFNEEIDRRPAPDDSGDDLAAAREAVDDLLGGTISGSVGPVAAPADPADSAVAPEDRIDLARASLDESIDLGGSDLDLGSPSPLVEGAADADLDLSADPSEDPNAIAIDYGIGSEDSASPATFSPAEPEGVSSIELAAPDQLETTDDRSPQLGSSDDWQRLTGDTAPEPSSRGTPIGRLSPSVPEERTRPSEDAAPVTRGADDVAFDVDAQTFSGVAWISRARGGVGWALVGLLCAYAGFVGLWPRALASEPVVGARPIAGFTADAVRGSWIENAAEGSIYVVSGELRAAPSAPAPTGSLLRVRLLDADGRAVRGEPAAVGPLVSEKRLRNWSLQDLRELQESRAARLAWDPLAPGGSRRFHAIVGSVPPGAVAFDFEVTAAPSPAPEPDAGAYNPPPAPDVASRALVE